MLLLIPGPVTTHDAVRAVAAQDHAPWDNEFRTLVARLRDRVRDIAGGRESEHAGYILQGCGHFALEAACRTLVPEGGRILLPKVGQYADRFERLATETGRIVVPLAVQDDKPTDPEALRAALKADPSLSHVALVYSETSTGLIHDVPALAAIAGEAGRRVIVDAVSALGALPFDIGGLPMVDCVVCTTNKCFEGLPGASLVVARSDRLAASVGRARSWSFDLADMHVHYKHSPGAFRFTPAAGVVAAFGVALELFDAEGGQPARLARYTANMRTVYDGVLGLGLRPYLSRDVQGPVVVNVHAPPDPAWNLQSFVDGLKSRGVLISNFYNTPLPSFRVGCIGAITPEDMRRAVNAMDATLADMGIRSRQAA